MKTLEEVKKHFKNAKTVRCIFDEDLTKDIKKIRFKRKLSGSFYYSGEYENRNSNDDFIALWSEDDGYAEILTYKNPKMKITKKQIKKLDKGEVTVRELFPDVFEKDVKFTGWAKDDSLPLWIGYYENDVFKYGISSLGYWIYGEINESKYNEDSANRPATDQEVTEALTKEAVKTFGDIIKDKTLLKSISGNVFRVHNFNNIRQNYFYNEDDNCLSYNGIVLFKNGKWATIIETITKEEAEKELGKTIID